MTTNVLIALLTWPVVVLVLFGSLRPRTAILVSFIGAWMFLPIGGLRFSDLPDLTKSSITSLSVLLGALLFDMNRLALVRPKWFDVPMLVWWVMPMVSSLVNGLGLYDGVSATWSQTITWVLPYLIGRAYFNDAESLRELALGIMIGGLVYVPLCLLEVRISPQLHRMVYGYHQHSFAQTIRYGGFRPTVFMAHGLEVGMWMVAATLTAYWLWAAGALQRLRDLPVGRFWLPVLLVTVVLCKSTGVLILGVFGTAALWTTGRTGSRWPLVGLMLIPLLYVTTRTTNTWSGRDIVPHMASWFGEDRAGSLEFRLNNEDVLIDKAMQQPIFGWGGWGRSRVFNEKGEDLTVTDGLWVIALGLHGVVGLAALTSILLLPIGVMAWHYPGRSWRHPTIAPAAVLAVLLALYAIDNLMNAMINPVYLLAIGGVVTFGARRPAAGLEDPPSSVSHQHTDLDLANDLAWSLANAQDPSHRDTGRAIELAKEVVQKAPECAIYWNTLGVARYRANAWSEAIEALQHSVALTSGGTAFDYFFLAMAYHKVGDEAAAWSSYNQAKEWMNSFRPDHPELLRIRDETHCQLESTSQSNSLSNSQSNSLSK